MRFLLLPLLCLCVVVSMGAESPRARRTADTRLSSRNLALGAELLKWDKAQEEGGWEKWSPRPDLSPGMSIDRLGGSSGVPALKLTGGGRKSVFGGWRYTVSPLQGSKPYRFTAKAQVKGVESIRRNIVCRITWTGDDLSNEITSEYVNEFTRGQGYLVTFDQTFVAPPQVTGAVVDIFLQWAPLADVSFTEFSLKPAPPETPRTVRVATVYWRPSEETTAEKNIESFAAMVDQAGEKRPDIILLPEAITSVGIGSSVPQAAEKMPGKAFFELSARARKYKCYIIYGIYEQAEGVYYNSAHIIDRNGVLAGTYHKVQLPPSEVDAGLSPGDLYRTYELDFGTIGIQICHDSAFDEASRIQMLDGAEIIFIPIWGGDVTALKARAIDNGVWVVTSGYDVPSMVIDPTGQQQAVTWQAGIGDGVAVHLIDLTKTFRRPYIGDWRNQVVKQRRTDAYLKIVQE